MGAPLKAARGMGAGKKGQDPTSWAVHVSQVVRRTGTGWQLLTMLSGQAGGADPLGRCADGVPDGKGQGDAQ